MGVEYSLLLFAEIEVIYILRGARDHHSQLVEAARASTLDFRHG